MPGRGLPVTIVWWSSTGSPHASGLPRVPRLALVVGPLQQRAADVQVVAVDAAGLLVDVDVRVQRGRREGLPSHRGDTSCQVWLPSYDAKIWVLAWPTTLSKSAAA
jgi:hypothetical protein